MFEGMGCEPFDLKTAIAEILLNCDTYDYYRILGTVKGIEGRLRGKANEVTRAGSGCSFDRKGEMRLDDATGFRYRIGVDYFDEKTEPGGNPFKTKYYIFNLK